MTLDEYRATFRNHNTKIYNVFCVLADHAWHCRECEYEHVGSSQLAGGGGIQGLERGNASRPGIRIKSGNHFCAKCERKTRQDRWTGEFSESVSARSIPKAVEKRILSVLGEKDVIDQVSRRGHQLTPDHKLPMIRWTNEESERQTDYNDLTDHDIKDRFQLLKKSNGSISDNLLKSRTCEKCFRTGNRGTPMGIKHFYSGGSNWEPEDKKDPSGCVGCGWYDFAAWRESINKTLTSHPETSPTTQPTD